MKIKLIGLSVVFGLLSFSAFAQLPDSGSANLIDVEVFSRTSSNTPVSQWKSVGGTVVYHYENQGTYPSQNFTSMMQLPLNDHTGNMLTRVTINDSAGNQLAYCNDIQLGFAAQALSFLQDQAPNDAVKSFAHSLILRVLITLDGSAKTFAEFGDTGAPSCDAN